MNNKRHNIIDDAWDMKDELLGSSKHSLRVGLVVNTVINAMPIVIDDLDDMILERPKFDHEGCQHDLPVLLHFKGVDMQVAILLVYDKDSKNIQCYPFNDLNEGGYWWLYEMAFDIVPGGLIEIRPVHPLLEEEEFEPNEAMMSHLESLATVVNSFLQGIQDGTYTAVEDTVDYSKINKKRIKNGKTPIINDWKLVHAS